jgi:peptidoglycan/xylan/chitin deacetylase (PgdA/CDA1 family)
MSKKRNMNKECDIKDYYNSQKLKTLALTFDTDWAPEFIIEEILAFLSQNKLKATFFATNPSPALEYAEKRGEIEIGLHPNFLPNSSHGTKTEDIIKKLNKWYPKAIGFRSHGLVQSSNILRSLSKFGIKYDCNLLLYDAPYLQPFSTFYNITRIPYNWSDASHILDSRKMNISELFLESPGLKVLDFHPLLWYLNSSNYNNYNHLKENIKDLRLLKKKHCESFIFNGIGIKTLLEVLKNIILKEKLTTFFIRDLHNAFIKSNIDFENKMGKNRYKPFLFEPHIL